MDYAHFDLNKVMELDVLIYWTLLRDAVIHNHMQTEAGREYLENCWTLEQTKPDKEKLKEKYGKGAK